MKLLTAEDEAKFYRATVKEGTIGGIVGLAVGSVGVYGASKRFSLIRNLTLPFKVFLAVSTGSFAAIICADRGGRAYEKTNHPDRGYHDERQALLDKLDAERTQTERALHWANENRYSIVAGSWVASMATAFALVSRSPMNTAQKLVQARVYAQGLTMAVVIASLALEGADMKAARSEEGKVVGAVKKRLSDKDQWMDMVEAEEQRLKERKEAHEEHENRNKKDHHREKKQNTGSDKASEKHQAKEDDAAKKEDEHKDKKEDHSSKAKDAEESKNKK